MIELLAVFYGDIYADLLCDTLASSLFRKDIAELQKSHEIIHNIYCTKNEEKKVSEYCEIAKKHNVKVFVNTDILGDDPRERLYIAIIDQIKKSVKNKSIIVMAWPDHVFGSGLKNVIDGMKQGDYVVCGHPRISLERGLDKTRDAINYGNNNRELVKLCVDDIQHKIVNYGKRGENGNYWSCEKRDTYYSVFAKEPPPVAFYGTMDLIPVFDTGTFGKGGYHCFEEIDHALVDYALQNGRLRIIDDSDVFFWAEFTSDEKYKLPLRNNYMSSAARYLCAKELKWRFE